MMGNEGPAHSLRTATEKRSVLYRYMRRLKEIWRLRTRMDWRLRGRAELGSAPTESAFINSFSHQLSKDNNKTSIPFSYEYMPKQITAEWRSFVYYPNAMSLSISVYLMRGEKHNKEAWPCGRLVFWNETTRDNNGIKQQYLRETWIRLRLLNNDLSVTNWKASMWCSYILWWELMLNRLCMHIAADNTNNDVSTTVSRSK